MQLRMHETHSYVTYSFFSSLSLKKYFCFARRLTPPVAPNNPFYSDTGEQNLTVYVPISLFNSNVIRHKMQN